MKALIVCVALAAMAGCDDTQPIRGGGVVMSQEEAYGLRGRRESPSSGHNLGTLPIAIGDTILAYPYGGREFIHVDLLTGGQFDLPEGEQVIMDSTMIAVVRSICGDSVTAQLCDYEPIWFCTYRAPSRAVILLSKAEAGRWKAFYFRRKKTSMAALRDAWRYTLISNRGIRSQYRNWDIEHLCTPEAKDTLYGSSEFWLVEVAQNDSFGIASIATGEKRIVGPWLARNARMGYFRQVGIPRSALLRVYSQKRRQQKCDRIEQFFQRHTADGFP